MSPVNQTIVRGTARFRYLPLLISIMFLIPISPALARGQETTTCATPDPFVTLGGGTCVNGGWLPPGMIIPPPPPPGPPPPPAAGECATPDPFVALGGGTCVNGGWLPPGMIIPPPQPPEPPPPPAGGACGTPDPFVTLGGGTCVNGGWLPPGMVIPAPSHTLTLTLIQGEELSGPWAGTATTSGGYSCTLTGQSMKCGPLTVLDGTTVVFTVALAPQLVDLGHPIRPSATTGCDAVSETTCEVLMNRDRSVTIAIGWDVSPVAMINALDPGLLHSASWGGGLRDAKAFVERRHTLN